MDDQEMREYSSDRWELWWTATEKDFEREIVQATEAFTKKFLCEPTTISFNENTVLSYTGPLEALNRKNIPSKFLFVLERKK
jgi:hypothetical protein